MTGRRQTAFLYYGRCLIIWLLIAITYLCGLKAYLGTERNTAVNIFLSSAYPDQARVEEIITAEQEKEFPSDVCFYWDGGIRNALQKEYGRQSQVLVVGLLGRTGLYDWKASGLAENDKQGCLIDRKTAVALFGSAMAEGGEIRLGKDTYQVRKVLPWKQSVMVIRPKDKESVYTRAFVRPKTGETAQSAAERFLMSYGLSGSIVDGEILNAAALIFLILFPGVLMVELFVSAFRESRKYKEHQKEYWFWSGACVLVVALIVFLIVRYVRIPVDWIPGKWSDFQFWPDKIAQESAKFKLYLMLPKTVTQAEQMVAGFKAMLWPLISLILYLISKSFRTRAVSTFVDTVHTGAYNVYTRKNE